MTNKGILRQAYVKFYTEEAKQIIDNYYNGKQLANENNIKASDDFITLYLDKDATLKKLLMQKFLSIFGDFKWQKRKSYFNINNLIILPDNLSLDTDDCIMGKYENINIKLTEVLFGPNSIMVTSKKYQKFTSGLALLVICAIIGFVLALFMCSSGKIIDILFDSAGLLFILTWGLIYFSIPIMLVIYITNYKNKGLVIEIDMPKNFEGETVLFENAITNLFVNKKALKNFEKTTLEDVEFNKKYSIYTTNQIECRYVLTSAFVEQLKNIKFKFNAKYLRMIFKNNRLTIFASTRQDLFKMIRSGEKTSMETFNVLFEEIYSVLSLVDELKLNIKTGL